MSTPHPASALTAKQAVLRFAPSPNGPLHRGHALSAWLNDALAHRIGGRLLLRIEDIDPARSRPDHIAAIEETLAWLGVDYEQPVRRQSQHMAVYREAFKKLKMRGLVYPCFCTRGEIEKAVEAHGPDWPRDPDGSPLYPRRCHALSADDINARLAGGEQPQWRLDVPKAAALAGLLNWQSFDPATFEITSRTADPSLWGDVVLVRKDTPTSYHLSVVVDDAEQGVTHVVRGMDLEAATDIHVLLQALLGLPQPLYWHHGLITGPDGKKLAKSRCSDSLALEREKGLTREHLLDDFQRAGIADGLTDAEHSQP
jgi:glutamyl-Q tRNA(Asp) synthetase